MKDVQLRVYDGVAVSCFFILPGLFLTGLSGLVRRSDSATWIVLLLSALLMACLFALLCALMRRHEGKDIVSIASAVAGRPFGLLYGVALGVYFSFIGGIGIREAAEITKLYALSATPLPVVAGCLLLAALAMNAQGAASIVKSAGFFAVVMLAALLFALAIGVNGYNPDHLFPLWGHGAREIVHSGLWGASVYDGVIVLLLFAPAFSGARALRRSGVLSVLAAAAGAAALCAASLMSFSPSVSAWLLCNFIEIGKSSYYNHFFYRFESVLLLALIALCAVQAALALLAARESVARAVGSGHARAIAVACAAAMCASAALPGDMHALVRAYTGAARRYGALLVAGVPLALLLLHSIRRAFGHESR